MSESELPLPDSFVRKHLARNVPIDFMRCCERVRTSIDSKFLRRRRLKDCEPIAYEKFYPGMLDGLGLHEASQQKIQFIGEAITEIRIRYEAVQKTLDQSVPAKPIYERLRSMRSMLQRAEKDLQDNDRDEIVRFFRDDGSDEIPSASEDFDQANSIAERAAICHAMVERVIADVDQMIEYFDYKQGLVTRGNPSRYANLYAVHALGELFEAENTRGAKAHINETINSNENRAINKSNNNTRYTGHFLDFLIGFFRAVDARELSRPAHEGFLDTLRKLSQSRNIDPGVHLLLHGDVSVEDVLEFMKRADSVKPKAPGRSKVGQMSDDGL